MKSNIKIIIFFILAGFIVINFIKYIDSSFFTIFTINGLSIVNFDEQLCSKEVYNSIKCRKSIPNYVSPTICVHDLTKDRFVSGKVWNDGIWEPHILSIYLSLLNKNKDALVFDIGAQIGQYSLFAAKMGRKVIAVEPFYESILRIQKAAKIEHLENRITLIRNAVSNIKGEIKRLSLESRDIGGQGLIKFRNISYKKSDMKNDKYLVETILFDDLISVLPKMADGSDYKKAVIKIDIEGFEPYAFESASKIFSMFDFQGVFMEWVHVKRLKDQYMPQIQNMFQLFKNQKLIPYYGQKKLDMESWENWPFDVYWIKE